MSHWPQYTVIVIMAFGLLLHACFHGEKMTAVKWNFALKLWGVGFTAWLLWCGGFWEPILR